MPTPLHPAVVHFPVALAVLLPILAIGAAVRCHRTPSRLTWGVVVFSAALLAFSSWMAVETGEEQEEVVEAVVPRAALHEHEEAAEALLAASGIVTVLLAVGLVSARWGRPVRAVGAAATLALLPLAWGVGSSGGALVYEHGAAAAYVDAQAAPATHGATDDPGGEPDHQGALGHAGREDR